LRDAFAFFDRKLRHLFRPPVSQTPTLCKNRREWGTRKR
jgi:hypothetical protein